jgi:hypothetical protein
MQMSKRHGAERNARSSKRKHDEVCDKNDDESLRSPTRMGIPVWVRKNSGTTVAAATRAGPTKVRSRLVGSPGRPAKQGKADHAKTSVCREDCGMVRKRCVIST